jgi:signal transduction histidine kinase
MTTIAPLRKKRGCFFKKDDTMKQVLYNKPMSASLFLHNFIFIIGGITSICISLLVLFYSRKKMTSSVATFALFCIAAAVFQISQVLGANAADAVTSRFYFMFNLTNIFIGIFWTHWFLALIGKVKEKRLGLGIIYASGLSLLVFFLSNPTLFLVNSVPKMYLPFYYEPGHFYFVMVIWFFFVAVYYFYQLGKAYLAEKDPVQKNRFRYVLASMVYAFVIGTTAFALVFDIPLDPLISSFCGFYVVVLAYAMVQYELLDIRILAKRAFVYALVMIAVGGVILIANAASNYATSIIPGFPQWVTPAILAIIVSSAGIYIWRKARENDIAKYEFITVIMHKFRTPLTEVRWASEVIAEERQVLSAQGQEALDVVEESTGAIVELTNVLVSLNDTDKRSYTYSFTTFSVAEILTPLIKEHRRRYTQKTISFVTDTAAAENILLYSDPGKIKFAIDILLTNALHYTQEGGTVSLSVSKNGPNVLLTFSDNGIGISKKVAPLIFSKFYRGDNARKASTEGTGIGLYLAHEITRRSGGTLTFTSAGEGKGTTFVMSLPIKS